MSEKRRALISVSDKSGVVEFARGLAELGIEIISTGGTRATLEDAGVEVRDVSEVTGVPEILGGRVKTLHAAIFAGILARREMVEDLATLDELGIGRIDIIAVNLYPFEQTINRSDVAEAQAIEQIDIGGPSLLRAAAKNHGDVYAIVDPDDYGAVLDSLREGHESETKGLRRKLAGKVFAHTSRYDRIIAGFLDKDVSTDSTAVRSTGDAGSEDAGPMPQRLRIDWPLKQRLRYGENPHQAGAFYADPEAAGQNLAQARQLQGKELSYNNYLDGDTALAMAREYAEPVAVILKHSNPCGIGTDASLVRAYEKALECDPLSAFGGIVGVNRPVGADLAQQLAMTFLEVVIAPEFDEAARAILAKKKNLRLLEVGAIRPLDAGLTMRSVAGGMLVQEADMQGDARADEEAGMKVVTKTKPTDEDRLGLDFAWKAVKWVKSNAIVYTTSDRTLGIGAGQMSRIDAAKLALEKARSGVEGSYLGSDAFFPFRDVVDLAAEAGVRGIIQPGGSIRDEESIAAADEHGLIMIFTGRRHFRH